MCSSQVQDELAVSDLSLSKGSQASARRIFAIFEHFLREAPAILAPKRVHLGSMPVCLLLEKLFGLGLGAIRIKQALSKEVLLGISHLTVERPDLPILDCNTGKNLERRMSLILPGFIHEQCPTHLRSPL